MEVSISIVAIVISVVGLVIAYLSYKTSNDTRRETNQLRLVDKVIEYGLVVQKDMATLIQIRYETEAIKELTENISIEKTEKSKVTRHLSDILNNLDSIESGFR
ncbi:hypothetical protein, partial [Vibrio campbellii]|uniref:hypothetical protein n=1 Tax=Vibrio campbellii TaxID=680 RepID=UPI000B24C889